ncbi:hypothetical protein [Flagellimonas allohymeniacidonis]|uniref:DUF1579 domain-containing protein n=1 Tax=Flagellimonas allohymeniacidonis TaxID=2517819 RepID=A0A4Q8QG14_9FLAO|nr:hypothetical protein [Allomuricauda hymeniacidonis]TAI49465.1 hypothetical protein EW142_06595 [Allomuricauda hymeniacidonis]
MKKVLFLVCCASFFLGSAQTDDSCNCCSEIQKAFDFWVGEWEVTNNTNGSIAGYNSIVKQEDGCVLRENWTSAQPGYTGTSLNFYNKANEEWEQLWVDNTGAALKLRGKYVDSKMILSSEEFQNDGKSLRNRITWFNNEDGTVRQLWEVLEGEKVVSVAFDGIYKRK